ncbi:hypothetical protein BACT_1122 [Bifidobacterium actinocoloniiforme DSM 22766]|uniref:Uncharacterized protein n=1 Tax=Bifidobacterium actinocoloniiforme DSM 22766 TaxID=1437605 RepID=A0A086Z1L8_9BIFI|nr:hypothetical protein BACT_1122 [Bifidobacterium actinocoloniiforme DSM 22766]
MGLRLYLHDLFGHALDANTGIQKKRNSGKHQVKRTNCNSSLYMRFIIFEQNPRVNKANRLMVYAYLVSAAPLIVSKQRSFPVISESVLT